jgi:hypothetical protein
MLARGSQCGIAFAYSAILFRFGRVTPEPVIVRLWFAPMRDLMGAWRDRWRLAAGALKKWFARLTTDGRIGVAAIPFSSQSSNFSIPAHGLARLASWHFHHRLSAISTPPERVDLADFENLATK